MGQQASSSKAVQLFTAAAQGDHNAIPNLLHDKGGPELINSRLGSYGSATDAAGDWTPLMVASAAGHTMVVKALLELQADVNVSAMDGQTSLMLATENGHSSIAKMLMKRGANIDAATESGQTALIKATATGNAYIAESLVRAKANVNATDHHDGMTALSWAAKEEPSFVVQMLIDAGAEVNARNHNGQTPLICAASKDYTYTGTGAMSLEMIAGVESKNSAPGLDDQRAISAPTSVVETLINAGAAINARNHDGYTALMVAAWKGHSAVVHCIMAAKASLDVKADKGQTALVMAAYQGHNSIAEALVTAKADLDISDEQGHTALHKCAVKGRAYIAQCLLKAKANINAKDTLNGMAPLSLACTHRHTAIVQLLLVGRCEVDSTDHSGRTALMLAAGAGHFHIMHMLLGTKSSALQGNAGQEQTMDTPKADVNVADAVGVTALMLAARVGAVNLVRDMLVAGADPNHKTHEGQTALTIAAVKATSMKTNPKVLAAELQNNALVIQLTAASASKSSPVPALQTELGHNGLESAPIVRFDSKTGLPTTATKKKKKKRGIKKLWKMLRSQTKRGHKHNAYDVASGKHAGWAKSDADKSDALPHRAQFKQIANGQQGADEKTEIGFAEGPGSQRSVRAKTSATNDIGTRTRLRRELVEIVEILVGAGADIHHKDGKLGVSTWELAQRPENDDLLAALQRGVAIERKRAESFRNPANFSNHLSTQSTHATTSIGSQLLSPRDLQSLSPSDQRPGARRTHSDGSAKALEQSGDQRRSHSPPLASAVRVPVGASTSVALQSQAEMVPVLRLSEARQRPAAGADGGKNGVASSSDDDPTTARRRQMEKASVLSPTLVDQIGADALDVDQLFLPSAVDDANPFALHNPTLHFGSDVDSEDEAVLIPTSAALGDAVGMTSTAASSALQGASSVSVPSPLFGGGLSASSVAPASALFPPSTGAPPPGSATPTQHPDFRMPHLSRRSSAAEQSKSRSSSPYPVLQTSPTTSRDSGSTMHMLGTSPAMTPTPLRAQQLHHQRRLSNASMISAGSISEWGVADVSAWLQRIELPQYQHQFADASIDGEMLIELAQDKTQELLIEEVGVHRKIHRLKLLREIRKLMAREEATQRAQLHQQRQQHEVQRRREEYDRVLPMEDVLAETQFLMRNREQLDTPTVQRVQDMQQRILDTRRKHLQQRASLLSRQYGLNSTASSAASFVSTTDPYAANSHAPSYDPQLYKPLSLVDAEFALAQSQPPPFSGPARQGPMLMAAANVGNSAAASPQEQRLKHIQRQMGVPRSPEQIPAPREIPFEELVLNRQIGKGAFGTVYQAHWRGAAVAVKKLHAQDLDREQLAEFIREAGLMELLGNHPSVVRFCGVCSKPPNLCIVTQFLPHGSIESLLRKGTVQIDFHTLMRMARDAASGVLHLHLEGVIHRDLAARNLLVDRDLSVRVTDFGMSRLKKASVGHTDSRLGPVKWMSPEALMHNQYSEKSDAWSFGVTLWEIYCRQPPFVAMENLEAALKVSHDVNFRLPIPDDCPEELASLMRDCWNSDPAQRPSFDAIVLRLEKLLESLARRPRPTPSPAGAHTQATATDAPSSATATAHSPDNRLHAKPSS